jgi:hypothetical protein
MTSDLVPLRANEPEYLGKLCSSGAVFFPEADAQDVAAVLAVLRPWAVPSLRPLRYEVFPAPIIGERVLLVLTDRFGIELHGVS